VRCYRYLLERSSLEKITIVLLLYLVCAIVNQIVFVSKHSLKELNMDTENRSLLGLLTNEDDESCSYMVLEPRESYDQAMVGLLPINDSKSNSAETFTHTSVYCRIKTLIALSKLFEPRIPWSEVLEFHYFNQDSTAQPPYPLYLDPPEDWWDRSEYESLFKEYEEALKSCPEESEDT